MLADDGALILKFWFHLSKERQRKRLKSLQKDPETRWRITERDWDFFKMYDRFYEVSEHALRDTSTAWAPWIIVEGSDPEYRAVTVGRTLLEGMRERLKRKTLSAARPDAAPLAKPADKRLILHELDQTRTLSKKRYEKQLRKYQRELALLTRHPKFAEHTVIAAFEGMDAAGKGGAIRRITAALDARLYHIIPVAAPTDEERSQSHLWRFWRHLPMKGRYTIYDRTWYGRVLVERVEGFAGEPDWMRAYSEINDFEEQLVRFGTILGKFWLQPTKEEQHRRFKEREKTRHKQFKITAEDWRNRKRWNQYEQAASDMIERTSTSYAPWTLVEANDKYWARVKILRTLCERVEQALDK
jgi:polyphosphate:AMP phosphotransferase